MRKKAELKKTVRSVLRTMEWDNLTQEEAENVAKKVKKAVKRNRKQLSSKDVPFSVLKKDKKQISFR